MKKSFFWAKGRPLNKIRVYPVNYAKNARVAPGLFTPKNKGRPLDRREPLK